MALQANATGGKKRFRHRLQHIELQPSPSRYDIAIELLVDGETAHKLPKVKKGQPLHWRDLVIPCDVHEDSVVTLRITEIHTLRDRAELATYHVAHVVGQHTLSIGGDEGKYTAQLTVLGDQEVEQAYQVALVKVGRVEGQSDAVKKNSQASAAFKTLLALGSTVVESVPTAGAKEAFTICANALQHLERQSQQDADLDAFLEDLARTAPSIESVKHLADARLTETVLEMLNLIEDISLFVLGFKSRSSRGKARSLYYTLDSSPRKRMEAFVVKFKRLRKEFDTRMNMQILEIQQIEGVRSKLKPVRLAGYDPTRACMPNTRTAAIHDIATWVHSKHSGRGPAWVYGLAGLGKSSVASSVCQQFDEQHALAASFFCKRDSPELRDPCRVITTLAYGLSLRWKPYGNAVTDVIRTNPDLELRHVRPLYDSLVSNPLKSIMESERPVFNLLIVVDALDECGDIESRKQLLACLWDMSQLTPWLKIIVTSRPDMDIQEFFGRLGPDWFVPYNLLSYDALSDIRIYIGAQLSDMNQVKGWPAAAVDMLSDRSSGLFIWARTACKFIVDGYNPCKRLEQVLFDERLLNSSSQLDILYTTAIKASTVDEGEDNISSVLWCLGVVIATATRTPLPISDLSNLLCEHISEYTLHAILRSLSSVLYLDLNQGSAIRISHPSFMDYITDPGRSKELCVNLDGQNALLAQCCLETMSKELRFNICDLETSHLPNCDVPNLSMRVQEAIGPHLSYSCVYWASHITHTQSDRPNRYLREFLFGPELLYWIEALSLLGKLGVAPPSLLELSRAVHVAEDCRAYAHDVYRFILGFYDAISESTPHLYISALAFVPENSKLIRRMRSNFPNILAVAEGAETHWSSCLRIIWEVEKVHAVAFSPDGHRIVTGSGGSSNEHNNVVGVWDAKTGAPVLEPLRGHSSSVNSVAFSPDGLRIVSGSNDETVRVWDATTGVLLLEPLHDCSGSVLSVAFCPDGHRIVAGSDDDTVRVWDAQTGDPLLEPMRGHLDCVRSVAFSPDSQYIVSGSDDRTLRVWDAQTGVAALQPLEGHSGYVMSVAFSPNSQRIVSGSFDRTVRIWDKKIGAMLLEPLRGHSGWVFSVMFSLDGLRIVSASNDKTVRVWDAETGATLLVPLRGHSAGVSSAAFSPDGRRVVSGSHDETIRIWDTEVNTIPLNRQTRFPYHMPSATPSLDSSNTPAETWNAHIDMGVNEPLQGHILSVQCVAFSPDGCRIVSGSEDHTVRLWNAKTGAPLLEPLQGHSRTVNSVAFSPDGHYIASGSRDKTIRVWDAQTGAALFRPLSGHSEEVSSVVFSPDARRIVSGSDDRTVRVWDAETGAAVLDPLTGLSQPAKSVAYSSDGRRIVSGSRDYTLRLWSADTGAAMLEPLQGHSGGVTSVGFSPDSRRLVSGSLDWTIRVWDADTGVALLEPLQGHSGTVYSVMFSPDGRRIVSGSSDWTVRVWDAGTGAALLEPLRGHRGTVYSVAFSPDNRRIVSSAQDRTIRIWDIETCVSISGLTQNHLPGTQIPILPSHDNRTLKSTSAVLACRINSRGWITTLEGGLYLWLPLEYREIDDSIMCIPDIRSRRRAILDFSKFVHGSSWSLVHGT